MSSQEEAVFRRIIELSYGDDASKAQTARNILTRQAARVAPSLATRLAGAGPVAALATGAVGVWTVVGLELYYLPCWQCEREVVSVNGNFRIPQNTLYDSYENIGDKSTTVLTYYGANRTASADISGKLYGVAYVRAWDKWTNESGTNWKASAYAGRMEHNMTIFQHASADGQMRVKVQEKEPPRVYVFGPGSGSTVNGRYSVTVTVGSKTKELCPFAPSGEPANNCAPPVKTAPVEFGAMDASTPSGTPVRTSATEGNQYINNVVADPETAPLVDPMDVPQEEPDPDWDPNTDPFNPLFDPFDDPKGDPDGDGIPNETDPDPEGDEDPDGDGDPNEHPPLAPYPPSDDPEEDGDPDGDGDPDETNPYPTPNPLPEDDPNADPDQDGEPNESDPDDEGDGIPDEEDEKPYAPGPYPDDHPEADPDQDGEPNKTDPDDDGDGVPDTEDPAPYDPTVPGKEPGPGRDSDGDGVPDTIDPQPDDPSQPAPWSEPDADTDRIPDSWDPFPQDPALPEGGPDGDTDGDGQPNRHDPYPQDPAYPQDNPENDLDQDGTPDQNDPDPYRPSQPTGGPQGDPDNDGTPNSTDPAPNDSTQTGPGGGGCGCPVSPPKPRIVGEDGWAESLFPFNLFILAVDLLNMLDAPPKTPQLPPLFPEVEGQSMPGSDLSQFDGIALNVRRFLYVAGAMGALLMLYKLVSQSKEGE